VFVFPEAKPDFSEVPWQEDVDRRLKWGVMNAINCVQEWRGGKSHTNTLSVVEASPTLGLDEA
jgi:pyruvate kinase